eukprot:CAMPEP_0114434682 /NCGR_PEP_ID=MMETSP0103-20121206/12400_1 /TAXON_ID=37642 ORGANISM="Paraphysomonas imperforata, Strain PA2" /NCGR_SAMPLE_ID=MMETSP0103 /ASSEMBLY_ACC=CAM_ASM_000201 /LENGTH=69 /DNA_ID=CAMNT_0001604603 /DNA_START=36 /DNA_END=245 /DNA_ORIENTATION=-
MSATRVSRMFDVLHRGVVIFLAGNALIGFGWLVGGGAMNMIQYKLNPEKYTAQLKVDMDAALAASEEKK